MTGLTVAAAVADSVHVGDALVVVDPKNSAPILADLRAAGVKPPEVVADRIAAALTA